MARGIPYAVIGFMLLLCLVVQSGLAGAVPYLWQTNSAGNDVYIYELETFLLFKQLVVGPKPQGIAAPDDAHVVYISLEDKASKRGELLWVDPQSFTILHRLPVGPKPHAIATTPDGRWVYVSCRDSHYWVIDAQSKTVATRIYTGGRPHNTVASRDGRHMYLSPMGLTKRVTIVDVEAGHRVVGHIPFGGSVQASALSADQTLFLQQVDGLNGFQVADIAQHSVIATIVHSTTLGGLIPVKRLGWLTPQGFKRCDGLAIRPDQREIWSVCAENLTIHALRPPDFPERHTLQLADRGQWLTFTPDSRYAFVALTGRDQVAVVDTETKAVVRHLDAGKAPKRNLVITLP
jgi:DNA-binding beta-propeller fold protein YncE